MNGNRGAKGSIKDRLISMLYRYRYKKKELKEKEFTIPEKEKKAEYLSTLKEFDESENVNILDDTDRHLLDQVHFKAYYAQEGNKNVFNFQKLESDTLDKEVTDIKKETKKTKEEITILKEVTSFINESLEKIYDLSKDVEILKKEVNNPDKEAKKLEEEYVKLREKVDKLKKQFDVAKEKYDMSDFSILESIKLISSIENYKSLASLNEMEMMLKVCKKEINKIEGITIIYNASNRIGTNLQNVTQQQINAKVKFRKSKEKVNSISYLEDDIKRELEKQQQVIDEMYEEASRFEKKVSTKVEYHGYGKLLSSMLRIAGGILTLPLTGLNIFGFALGTTMINRGIKNMNKSLERREKIVIDYDYEDISNKISKVKDKLEYTNLVLSDSLNEIKKLKANLINYFKKYSNILQEYDDVFNKVENLEKKLILQQEKINKMNNKLDKEKEINTQKMKKLEH